MCVIPLSPMVYIIHGLTHKDSKSLGETRKNKKTKAPSQKHSKTIEKTKKNQKNQRSEQLWGEGRSSCLGQPLSQYRVFFVFVVGTYKNTR